MAPQSTSDGPFGLSPFVVWGGGLLLLALVAFAGGFLVGSQPIDDLSERLVQVETTAQEREAQVAGLEARLNAHRALSLLYRTMLDVDARNFGTANERLDEAASALAAVNRNAMGPGGGDLDALERDLTALDVRVAEDLARQRTVLAELARRLASILEL